MEILDLKNRIKLSIDLGESQYREFKSAFSGPDDKKTNGDPNEIKTDIGRTLVAFANAEGGELLIGVEDDGIVTGIPHSDSTIQKLLEASTNKIHSETPLPTPIKKIVEYEGKKILYFAVQKGTEYVYLTSDGRCLKRKDRDTIPISVENLSSQRFEDVSREFERQPVAGGSITDLDRDLIASVSGQITPGTSIEKCLQYLSLAEFDLNGLKLKKAAVLLFAKDIQKWHPGSFVRLICVNGKEKRSGVDSFNIIQDEIIMGNILTLIEESWKKLTIALIKQTRLSANAIFENSYLYPEVACREALLNAIVHRNYAIQGRGIEIEIYTDRIEIKSPGMLLSTISLDEIKKRTGVHESRNPMIARVLREIGYVREMGEGIRRIYNILRQNALAEPEFENANSGFNVIFYHKSMYDPKVKLWLSNFENYNLTENQMAVVTLGYNNQPFSTQDIIERLGIVDTDQVREILTPLRTLGVIGRALSANQAYFQSKKLGIPKREVKGWKVQVPTETKISDSKRDIDEVVEEIEIKKVDYFINNLPYNIDYQRLYEQLSKISDISSLSMPSGIEYGSKNKGYAFVTFILKKNVADLNVVLDNISVGGRKLKFRLQRSLNYT